MILVESQTQNQAHIVAAEGVIPARQPHSGFPNLKMLQIHCSDGVGVRGVHLICFAQQYDSKNNLGSMLIMLFHIKSEVFVNFSAPY